MRIAQPHSIPNMCPSTKIPTNNLSTNQKKHRFSSVCGTYREFLRNITCLTAYVHATFEMRHRAVEDVAPHFIYSNATSFFGIGTATSFDPSGGAYSFVRTACRTSMCLLSVGERPTSTRVTLQSGPPFSSMREQRYSSSASFVSQVPRTTMCGMSNVHIELSRLW